MDLFSCLEAPPPMMAAPVITEPARSAKPWECLRDYQVDVRERARSQVASGKLRGIIQSATGGGKTWIIADFARQCFLKGRRCLIVADRRKLIKQLGGTLDLFEVPYGVIMSDETHHTHLPIICASRDTLAAWRDRDLALPEPFSMVIIDEAHKSMGDVYQSLLRLWPFAVVIGFTATPARSDGKSLGDFYQFLECTVPTSRLVADGWLVRPDIYWPKELAVKRAAGQSIKGVAGDPVLHWKTHAEGMPTIGFAANRTESIELCKRFNDAGIPAEHIDGSEKDDEKREAAYARLQNGTTMVLWSVKLLIEGVDFPGVSCAILHAKFGSIVEYMQACLDEKTEVLSKEGWKSIGQVTEKDWIANFDMEFDQIHWCHPTNVFDRQLHTGEMMCSLNNQHLDIRVTDNHDMVYKCYGPTAANWQKRQAYEFVELGRSKIRIPVSSHNYPESRLNLDDSEIRFIGWFMTDGTLNKINNVITIYQSAASPYLQDIEKCLQECNFRYGISRTIRTGRWAGYADGLSFTISYGMPQKKSDRHMTGWSRLENYLSKDLHESLENLSPMQLETLLEAMNLGDGSKPKNLDYIKRTWHIGTGNRLMADRLQSLCIRRGFACNIRTDTKNRKNPYYTMYIKRFANDRVIFAEEFKTSPIVPGERVWCMTTDFGTLITRRNGKVAIVGNCGRIMRPAPGKTKAIILDHSGASGVHRHPCDDIQWSLDMGSSIKDRRKKKDKDDPDGKPFICRECGHMYARAKACPSCGCKPKEKRSPSGGGQPPQIARDEILTLYDANTDEHRQKEAESQQRFWIGLLYSTAATGMTLGVAASRFKKKFGVLPWQAGVSPLPAGRGMWQMPTADVFPQYDRSA